jgi:hypothetical protein
MSSAQNSGFVAKRKLGEMLQPSDLFGKALDELMITGVQGGLHTIPQP